MPTSYKDAGVNVDAGNQLIDRIKPTLNQHQPDELLADSGGFAALTRVPSHLKSPVLVTSTDGVGTKLELLIERQRLHTVGQDLVGMCVNDILVCGAQPSIFLDYFATSRLDVDEAETVIKSIAAACDLAGCSLVGGETAEMPGFYPVGKFDLAGFAIGWVDHDQILGSQRVQSGDILLGLASSGPHSNGFSLIRKLLRDNPPPDDLIFETLLAPTRLYVKSVIDQVPQLHAMAHITGGGLRDNLPRSLPKTLEACIDLNSLSQSPTFEWLQQTAAISDLDMWTTFNCGIGMVLFVSELNVDTVAQRLSQAGEKVAVMGEVRPLNSALKSNELGVAHNRFEVGKG